MLGKSIMIGGHPLSGAVDGNHYLVTRLAGWWDRPNVKRNVISRELADGDYLDPWNYEARYIAVDGQVDCRSHEDMHHIMDQLNGLAAVRREWMTVQGHGITQSAEVEADETTNVVPLSDSLLSFELRFKAPDPRKYGQEHRVPIGYSTSSYRHLGNYLAPVEVHLWAQEAPSGFQIADRTGEQSQFWVYREPLSSGQRHRVHLDTGRHYVGGVQRPNRVSRAETWALEPHVIHRMDLRPRLSGDDSRPVGDVVFRDTWI